MSKRRLFAIEWDNYGDRVVRFYDCDIGKMELHPDPNCNVVIVGQKNGGDRLTFSVDSFRVLTQFETVLKEIRCRLEAAKAIADKLAAEEEVA